MRIAMIGPFGFAPKKTMRSRAFMLARALVQRGHQVRIIMPPWHTPDRQSQVWHEDGVAISYVSLNGGMPFILRRILRETLAWQPDVVHCFKPKAYSGLIGEWLWRRHRSNLRVVIDSDDWEGWGGWNELENYPRPLKHFFARQELYGLKNNHALTVASRELESMALANDVPASRIHYLPNGSGIESHLPVSPSPSLPVSLLLYSRLFEFDVARLVNILEQVQKSIPELKVLMVGASLQAQDGVRFQRLMQEKGLWEMVEEIGWVEEAQLPAVLTSAETAIYLMDDTLLNRTKCPVKLADMALLGIPVVGERVGQVGEYIVHEKTGYLREVGDVQGISADLVTLLQDAEKRKQFGTAATVHMQQFEWARLAEQLEQVYRDPSR